MKSNILLKTGSVLLTVIISTVLYAQKIPEEIQQDILSNYPALDTDKNGVFPMKEYKKAQSELPETFRERVALFVTENIEKVNNVKTRKLLAELGLKGEQGIVYKESRQGRTLLDIVYPKNKVYTKAPVLVFVHGGSYTGGFRQILYKDMMLEILKRITGEGMAVATVGYRLLGVHDDTKMAQSHQDVKDALRYLAQNSERFGIDPHKIMLWGQSAGGSLALVSALTASDHLPGAVSGPGTEHTVIGAISYYGLTTFLEPSVIGEISPETRQKWFGSGDEKDIQQSIIDCSPDQHLKSSSPPLLIFNGELDPLVSPKNGRLMDQLGKKVGADVTYIEIKNSAHGITRAKRAKGKLSMNKPEATDLIHKHITKWVVSEPVASVVAEGPK